MNDHGAPEPATTVSFVANGKPRTAHAGATVADVLREFDLAPMQVLVEYNGEPLAREQFAVTHVRPGDNVEIAQMVGGG